MRNKGVASFMAGGFLSMLLSASVNAQILEEGGVITNNFGGQDLVLTWAPAAAFQPYSSNSSWEVDSEGYLYPTSGSNVKFWAPVDLPNGALLHSLLAIYINESAHDLGVKLNGYQTQVYISECAPYGTLGITETIRSLKLSAQHGDGEFDAIYIGSTVDLAGKHEHPCIPDVTLPYWRHYGVEATFPVSGGDLRLKSVGVYWKRQISPAPTSASFNDVPTTHSFFAAIEALKASGITGGCGGGNFCVNSPLTRGQMAAFLARALGLHFGVPSPPLD